MHIVRMVDGRAIRRQGPMAGSSHRYSAAAESRVDHRIAVAADNIASVPNVAFSQDGGNWLRVALITQGSFGTVRRARNSSPATAAPARSLAAPCATARKPVNSNLRMAFISRRRA